MKILTVALVLWGLCSNVASQQYKVVDVSTGYRHTCVILDSGELKCFGLGSGGRIGSEDSSDIGGAPGDMGNALLAIDLGTGVTPIKVSCGSSHTCVLVDDSGQNGVKCFGLASLFENKLGTASSENLGDDPGEMGDSLPFIDFGPGLIPVDVVVNGDTCVTFSNGKMKCFSCSVNGIVPPTAGGLCNSVTPAGLPFIDLGEYTVKQVSKGFSHTCVLLNNDQMKCFGRNAEGQLGYGDTSSRGFKVNEMGNNLTFVDVGNHNVTQISAGGRHTCALLDNQQMKCWGNNANAELLTGSRIPKLSPGSFVNVGSGLSIASVSAGGEQTCVTLTTGQVKCWGEATFGKLGTGDDGNDIGDQGSEVGDGAPFALLGTGILAKRAFAGGQHTCVLLTTDDIKCFGRSFEGQTGAEETANIGNIPGDLGDNLPVVNLGSVPTSNPPSSPSATPTATPTEVPSRSPTSLPSTSPAATLLIDPVLAVFSLALSARFWL